MTRRIDFLKKIKFIETFWWLKELNFLSKKNVTHRTEPFFLTHIPFSIKNWTLIFNMTQRIELFKNLTHRIEPLFQKKMTQRIELFWRFFWLKELSPFFNNIIHKWLTLFWTWLAEFNFFYTWLTELNFEKEKMTHRDWTLFETWFKEDDSIFSMTQRIFLFYKMYDSKNKLIVLGKNWICSKNDSKNWTFEKKKRSKRWTHFFSMWLKDLFFFETLRMEPLKYDLL